MRNFRRRLRQLEARRAQLQPPRVRWVDRYGEGPEEPEVGIDESDENTIVVVMQYIDAPPTADLGPARSDIIDQADFQGVGLR